MRTVTSLSLALVGAVLMCGSTSAQMTCFQYGNMTSCDGPRGSNTLQTDLGEGQGVIMGPRGEITPYAVIPPPSSRSRQTVPDRPYLHESQRPSNYFSPPTLEPLRPIEPTQPLFMPGLGGESGQ